ncbi:MAG: ATP-binding protein [Gemmatimonadota bacterium]|jgi:signal transduction histidine kinase
MRFRLDLSLRTKLIAIVLGGAVLPLALLGLWLNQTAERSGERILRERLEISLTEIAEDVGLRWLVVRGEILRIAELPEVHQGLREDRASGAVLPQEETLLSPRETPSAGSPPQALERLFAELEGSVGAISILDRDGASLWRYPAQGDPTGGLSSGGVRPLPVRLGVFNLASGDRLGTLEVDLPLSTLLSGSATWGGVAGSLLGAFEPNTGASLLPLSIDPFLLREEQFRWREETWLSVRRSLEEPPLELVLAAPVTPFVAPFQESAQRNLWILGGVTLLVLALAAALTRGTTRDLSRLAEAAEAVARGDLDREVGSKGRDEVGRVGRAFNTMTESLRNTLQELSQRRALAAVGEFAASMAHEVRNPLTSIRFDLQRMEEKLPDDEETSQLMARTIRKIDALNGSVTGALQVARSGSVKLEPMDLRTPLRAAIQMALPTFQERGADLDAAGAEGEPIEIRGDASALERLFLNLLLNAAQALEDGGRANVSVKPSDEEVRILIQDDGKGMEAEVLDRIFEPFFSSRPEGTGLGLPIAHRIAQAHVGDLSVESEAGIGTTVTVRLPQ